MALKVILSLLILFFIIMVGAIAIDSNRFVMREYVITSAKTDKDYNLVFLSDLHGKTYGKNNRKLLSAIRGIDSDYFLVGGDMITASDENSSFAETVDFLSKLSELGPVYYTFGNHESRARDNRKNAYGTLYKRFEETLASAKIVIHDNDFFELGNLRIYGLVIPEIFYYKKKTPDMRPGDVTDCIGTLKEERYNIVLAHNPDYFEAYAEWGADLVLSGHYHGGIARIPFGKGIISPKFTLFPKYDGGLFSLNSSKMIISRGLGMHTIPLRLFNPAEIVVIHIKKS